jgi:hypothetical protein
LHNAAVVQPSLLTRHQQRQAIDCDIDATNLCPIAPDTLEKMTWISKSVTVIGGILLAHA